MQLRAFIATGLLMTAGASAFDVDSFRTGMELAQVRALLATQNFTLMSGGASAPNLYFVSPNTGKSAQPAIMEFCNERLVAYSRQLVFESDYAHELAALLEKYGQPSS